MIDARVDLDHLFMSSRFRVNIVTFLACMAFSYDGAADELDVGRMPVCEIDNPDTLVKVTEEAKQAGQEERDFLVDAFTACVADNSILSDHAAYAAFDYGCNRYIDVEASLTKLGLTHEQLLSRRWPRGSAQHRLKRTASANGMN